MVESVLRRATIFVSDLGRAANFYRTVFGLETYYTRDMDLSAVADFPVGTEGRRGAMRFAILRGRDPLVGMIGLIEITGPPLDPNVSRRLGAGNAALVIETDDLDEVATKLVELGCTIVRAPTAGRNIGDALGNPVTAKVMFAFDPDGQFLEVFEAT